MVSLAVKTHWKLAFKHVKKALKVTVQTLLAMRRAKRYLLKIDDTLTKKRALFAMLDEGADTKKGGRR